MTDETEKNLPYVTEYSDGSFRAHSWGNEVLMEALNRIYRRQAEILDLLKCETNE